MKYMYVNVSLKVLQVTRNTDYQKGGHNILTPLTALV